MSKVFGFAEDLGYAITIAIPITVTIAITVIVAIVDSIIHIHRYTRVVCIRYGCTAGNSARSSTHNAMRYAA